MRSLWICLIVGLFLMPSSHAQAYTISGAPSAVAISASGNVFITEYDTSMIDKYSPAGKALATWHPYGRGAGRIANPTSIVVDTKGDMYVADSSNHRVVEYSPALRPISTWSSADSPDWGFGEIQGLARDSAGNIYVADPDRTAIDKFSPSGQRLATWHYRAEKIAVAPGGAIYLTNSATESIEELSKTGHFIRQWRSPPVDAESLPFGIAVSPSGYVWVCDQGTNSVEEYSASGHYMRRLGQAQDIVGRSPGHFAHPSGVATDSKGDVFVADTLNSRVQEFSPTGKFIRIFGR